MASQQIYMDLSTNDRNMKNLLGTSIQTNTEESDLQLKSIISESKDSNVADISRSRDFIKDNKMAMMARASNPERYGVRVRVGNDDHSSTQTGAQYRSNHSDMQKSDKKSAGNSTLMASKHIVGGQLQELRKEEDGVVLITDGQEEPPYENNPTPATPTIYKTNDSVHNNFSGISVAEQTETTMHLRTNPATRPISHSTGGREEIAQTGQHKFATVAQDSTAYGQEASNLYNSGGIIVQNHDMKQIKGQQSQQLLLSNSQMLRASLSIQNVKIEASASKSTLEKNSIFSKEGAAPQTLNDSNLKQDSSAASRLLNASNAGSKMMRTIDVKAPQTEASLTMLAVDDYQKKKNRYITKQRVFSDDKIASLDPATEVRAGLVASLLGNSREAQDIQQKFRRMVEVPQEDFSIQSFKVLASEVRNKLTKPNPIYSDHIKINPKRVKNLTQIEDFAMIQPTTAESHQDSSHMNVMENSSGDLDMLALLDEQTLAIKADSKDNLRNSQMIKTLESNVESLGQDGEQEEDEGDTFITNIVNSDEYSMPKQLSTLPKIAMRSQHRSQDPPIYQDYQVAADGRRLGKGDQVAHYDRYTNEYQLIPVNETSVGSIEQFRSLQHHKNSSASKANYHLRTQPNQFNADLRQSYDYSSQVKQTLPVGYNHNLVKSRQSLEILPRSRSKLQREPTELSFKLVSKFDMRERDGLNNSSGSLAEPSTLNTSLNLVKKRRILGDRDGFRHSHLSSYMGRENRVLKQIHKRVENFHQSQNQQKNNESSRLSYTQGLVSIAHLSKKRVGAKTAFRKYTAMPPLKPINVKPQQQKHDAAGKWQQMRPGEAQKSQSNLSSVANPMLSFDGLQSTIDGKQSSQSHIMLSLEENGPQIVAVDTETQMHQSKAVMSEYQKEGVDVVPELPKNQASLIVSIKTAFEVPNRTQNSSEPEEFGRGTLMRSEQNLTNNNFQRKSNEQFQTLQHQQESSQILPWTQTEPGMLIPPQSSMGKSIPASQSSQEFLTKKRLENQSVLNQYKQKRMLVSNLQVSKLIRKDMNMFRSRKQSRDSSEIITKEQQDKINAAAAAAAENAKTDQNKTGSSLDLVVDEAAEPGRYFRNSLLDEASSESANPNIQNLVTMPLLESSKKVAKPEKRKVEKSPETEEEVAKVNEVIEVNVPSFSQKDSQAKKKGMIPHKSTMQISQEQREDFNIRLHIKTSSSRPQTIENDFGQATKSQNQTFTTPTPITQTHHISTTQILRDASRLTMPAQQDHLQNEMKMYYRQQLNAAATRKSKEKQLADVMIRGKNIISNSNSNDILNNKSPKPGSKDKGPKNAILVVAGMNKPNRNDTRTEAITSANLPVSKQQSEEKFTDSQEGRKQFETLNAIQSPSELRINGIQDDRKKFENYSASTSPLAITSQPQTAQVKNMMFQNAKDANNRDFSMSKSQLSGDGSLQPVNLQLDDPYRFGSLHQQEGSKQMMRSGEFGTEPRSISSEKNKLKQLSTSAAQMHQQQAQAPHKLNIVSPFVTNASTKVGNAVIGGKRRQGSIESLNPATKSINKQAGALNGNGVGQGPMMSVLINQRNGSQTQFNNSEAQSTVAKSQIRGGKHAQPPQFISQGHSPNTKKFHDRKMSQVNMSANLDVSNIKNITQESDEPHKVNDGQQFDTIPANSSSNVSAKQHIKQAEKKSQASDTMGNTHNTLLNQSFLRLENPNNNKLLPQNVPPKIKIKMVLSTPHGSGAFEAGSQSNDVSGVQTAPNQFATLQSADNHQAAIPQQRRSFDGTENRMTTQGSQIVVQEGQAEPPLELLQMSIKSRERSRSRHTNSNESHGDQKRQTHNQLSKTKLAPRDDNGNRNQDLNDVIANKKKDKSQKKTL